MPRLGVGIGITFARGGGEPPANTMIAAQGSFQFSGQAATMRFNKKLAAAAANFAFSGQAATLIWNQKLAAAGASFAFTGQAATLLIDTPLVIQLNAQGATFNFSGDTMTPVVDYKLQAAAATFNFSGSDASALWKQKLAAAGATFAFTGTAATLSRLKRIGADGGSFAFTGTAATLTYNPAASATTLNPSDKAASVTLSGGDLIMTNSAIGAARSVASHSTGKYHFKFTPSVALNSYDHFVGLANASASLTADPASDSNIIGFYNGDPTIYVGGANGGNGGVTYQAFSGDVVEIEVDLGAQLWFSRVNGGDWNGNPAASPATGTGGIDFSAVSGPYYVYAQSAVNGSVNTLDFSGSGASSGYGPF